MGHSTNAAALQAYITLLNLVLAKQNQPARFGSYSNGHVVPGSIISIQTGFFVSQVFNQTVLQQAQDNQVARTYGELCTILAAGRYAPNYINLVAGVNGARNLLFCARNCS